MGSERESYRTVSFFPAKCFKDGLSDATFPSYHINYKLTTGLRGYLRIKFKQSPTVLNYQIRENVGLSTFLDMQYFKQLNGKNEIFK